MPITNPDRRQVPDRFGPHMRTGKPAPMPIRPELAADLKMAPSVAADFREAGAIFGEYARAIPPRRSGEARFGARFAALERQLGTQVQRSARARADFVSWASLIPPSTFRDLTDPEVAYRAKALAEIAQLDADCLATSKKIMALARERAGEERSSIITELARTKLRSTRTPAELRAEREQLRGQQMDDKAHRVDVATKLRRIREGGRRA